MQRNATIKMKNDRTTRKRWVNETGIKTTTARHGHPGRQRKNKAVNPLNGPTAIRTFCRRWLSRKDHAF